jgi:hypothetical protein
MDEQLLALVRRDFPEYQATHLIEAGIPVYFVRLQVEVLEPQELTNFEIYFLHAVALDVNTREDIARLLGLDDRDLVTPGASLLKRELITQGQPLASGSRPIFLTPRGRETMASQQAPPVPVRASAQVHLNAATWTPMALEETWSVERMDKEGLCILPPSRFERPTLGDFTLKEVDLALRNVPFFRENRLVKLLELKKATPEYIAPVTVVALRDRKKQEQRFAVYKSGALQRGESAVLQRHYETGHFQLPDDAVALTEERLEIPATLPPLVARVAQGVADNEAARIRLEKELTDSQTRRGGTVDRIERAQLEERIAALEAEMRTNHEESERLRAQLRQNQGTFLRTEEHRAVLERALKEAREEVIIISPWLNRRTCDDALCDLFASAIKRNVRIRIGYGITERAGEADAGRNRANAQKVIRALRTAVAEVADPAQAALLDIQRTSDTHQKILVCDRAFAVLGSFNWLSYRGELDREYRNETSIVLREPTSVEELARIALRGWPQQPG